MASAAASFSGVSMAPRCPHRNNNSVCLSVCLCQWTESGGLGLPSLPVLLPVGWGFRSRSGFVTVPPPNMAAGCVLDKDIGPESVRPTSTVQVITNASVKINQSAVTPPVCLTVCLSLSQCFYYMKLTVPYVTFRFRYI